MRLTSPKRLLKVTNNSLVMFTTSMISQPKIDFHAYHDYAQTTFAARCMVTLILGEGLMLLQTLAKHLQHVHGNVNFRLMIDVIANIRKTFTARCMVTFILG